VGIDSAEKNHATPGIKNKRIVQEQKRQESGHAPALLYHREMIHATGQVGFT
jgi:hypothetical protein